MGKLDEAIEEYGAARKRLILAQAAHRNGLKAAAVAAVEIRQAQAPFKASAEKLAQLLHADVSGVASYSQHRGGPDPADFEPEPEESEPEQEARP